MMETFLLKVTRRQGASNGERIVDEGLKSEKGKRLLMYFDFYSKTMATTLIDKELLLDPDTGVIKIDKFNPMEDLIAPKNVTHLQFRSLVRAR